MTLFFRLPFSNVTIERFASFHTPADSQWPQFALSTPKLRFSGLWEGEELITAHFFFFSFTIF